MLKFPIALTRGEYLTLFENGISEPGQLIARDQEKLKALLGETKAKILVEQRR